MIDVLQQVICFRLERRVSFAMINLCGHVLIYLLLQIAFQCVSLLQFEFLVTVLLEQQLVVLVQHIVLGLRFLLVKLLQLDLLRNMAANCLMLVKQQGLQLR